MAQAYSITGSQKKALSVATAVALLFGAYFLRDYFTLLIFAAILAFMFNPFYQRRLKINNNPGRAASQTLIFTFLAIIIPLTLILVITGVQINNTVDSINAKGGVNLTSISKNVVEKSNEILAKTPIDFRVTSDWLSQSGATVVSKSGSFLLNNVTDYAGNFFSFFTTAIIFIFVFLSLLKNQKTLLKVTRNLNPMGHKVSDIYHEKITAMTKAMVKGQFIIAILQGFTDALLVYIGGIHEAFFFFFMIMAVLSFIPLGGGIIAIPIGIAMMLTGNIVGGIIVIAGHLLIVTNIDNVLRPKLVPKEAKLDSALTILSVFAGIALLGFLGIIVGPVIMIVIVTTIKVYLVVNEKPEIKKVASKKA